LPALHGAHAGGGVAERAARRRGGRRHARLVAPSRVSRGDAAADRARHHRRLDPRLRADHQRAGDAAHAGRPDLSGHGDAHLRRIHAASRLAERLGAVLRPRHLHHPDHLDFQPDDQTLGGAGMNEQRPALAISSLALLVILFLQIPVIVVMLASFSETSYLTIPPQGWTLKWFEAVLTDRIYLDAIKNSLILAVGSTAISMVLGVAASYAIFRKMVPGSEALTSLLMAPLIIPSVVIGVALLQYFTLVGIRGSFWVLLIAHVVITVPYIVRSALASLSGIDLAVEEAARVLGANGFTTFRLVTLPLIKPGLV